MLRLLTIGHSTHQIDEFLDILSTFHILLVADVRTIPKSRHNPQFNEDSLRDSLKANGIEYIHMAGLGGLRRTTKASINTAWKNLSFRGYADYMQTTEFNNSLEDLIVIAKEKVTVIMCAESVPWRCHRSLIGDALLIRGFVVEDIMNKQTVKPHKLTPWARVEGSIITYPMKALQNDLP